MTISNLHYILQGAGGPVMLDTIRRVSKVLGGGAEGCVERSLQASRGGVVYERERRERIMVVEGSEMSGGSASYGLLFDIVWISAYTH